MFNLPSIRRSATLSLQALISGRVEDSVTHTAPLTPVTVRLIDSDINEPYPLFQRILPNGQFVFYGKPETAFPRLATKPYNLRVEASAVNYQVAAPHNIHLTATSGQPALVSVLTPTPGLGGIPVRSFTGGGLPIENILFSLVALP